MPLQRRTFAGHAAKAEPGSFNEFKQNWLMDVGAYPVMGVICFAVGFCGFVCTRCLLTNPDVRIDKSKRTSTLRTW